MEKKIKVPKFKSEKAERQFWSGLDLSRHFEPSDFGRAAFPNLKPSSRSISIRLPQYLLSRIKEEANEIDIPYQSLIKKYIAEGLVK
ncbi:MAG: BrnA antitoxin family protein [Candidatus Vogelbacteria bacterium]|nr:BrnA antitoxin family protein [Candidatus Vogelbacteria bacterium]